MTPGRNNPSPEAASRSTERGQSVVEFTLVLPVLLLVLFSIIEFGLVMYDKVSVIHDAREAARLAAVNDPAATSVRPGITFSCSSGGVGNSSYDVGDRVVARVNYTHTYVIPLIPLVLGGSGINLSTSETYRLEAKPTNIPGC
jgi:uncharacterized protein (UPF0333 family)